MNAFKKGFTMIELLIVIAVLGILAVAVLSAINPIEQINRSRDTGTRSDSEQLIGAVDRYYTVNGYYPWQTGATDTDDVSTAWQVVGDTWVDDTPEVVLTKLSSAGTAEIKLSFVTRITETDYNSLYSYNRGTQGDSTYVCFAPLSANFSTEGANRCAATLPGDFPASACGNVTDCGVSGNCVCLP